MFFNDPELDAIKDKYYTQEAQPSISTVMYLRDMEKKEAQERAIEESEKVKKEFADKEMLLREFKQQERLNEIAAHKDAMPYSDGRATEICERISSGELLTVICNDPHMPTARNVTRWLKAHSDFAALYNMALQDRLTIFEEQVIQFADSIPKEPQRATPSSRTEKVQFVDPVQTAKLQIEVRMRHLKAGRPSKWGDQSTLMVKQEDPFDCAALSSEEIERRIADIERKEAIMRPRALAKADLFK